NQTDTIWPRLRFLQHGRKTAQLQSLVDASQFVTSSCGLAWSPTATSSFPATAAPATGSAASSRACTAAVRRSAMSCCSTSTITPISTPRPTWNAASTTGRRFELLAHVGDLAGPAERGEVEDDDAHDAQVARRHAPPETAHSLHRRARAPAAAHGPCSGRSLLTRGGLDRLLGLLLHRFEVEGRGSLHRRKFDRGLRQIPDELLD